MTRKDLIGNIARKGSFLCVGLDPDIKKNSGPSADGRKPTAGLQQGDYRRHGTLLCGVQAESCLF